MGAPLSQYAALFGSFPEPVLVVSADKISYFNLSAARLFCNPPLAADGPLPSAFSDLFPADDGEAVRDYPNYMICGMPHHLRISPIPDGFLIVLRPSEDRLLLSANFLEVLTGRLRSPLNTLLSATSLIAPAIEATKNPDYIKYLSIINQYQYRLLRVLGNLNESITMIPSKEEEEQSAENTDLVAFSRNIAELADGLARISGRSIRFSASEERLITAIHCSQIERLILNLISNALKFTPPGGVVLFTLSLENNLAMLTVSDAGEGLDSGEMATVFSSYKAGVEPVAKPKGLGLGLTLVRHIAVRHGGSVMLESKSGKGTKVIVSLPVTHMEDNTLHAYRPPVDYSGGFSNILVELADALPPEAFLPQNME